MTQTIYTVQHFEEQIPNPVRCFWIRNKAITQWYSEIQQAGGSLKSLNIQINQDDFSMYHQFGDHEFRYEEVPLE